MSSPQESHRNPHAQRTAPSEFPRHAGDVDLTPLLKALLSGQTLTTEQTTAAFEAIGLPATAQQAFGMIRPGRTAYLVGLPAMGATIELPGAITLLQGRGLQGLFMGSNNFKRDIPMLANLYLQGRLKLDELVAATIDLEQVNDGYAAMRKGTEARSVIVF